MREIEWVGGDKKKLTVRKSVGLVCHAPACCNLAILSLFGSCLHAFGEVLLTILLACWRAWSSHKFYRAMHRPVAGLRQGRRRERNIMVEIQKLYHPTRASFGGKIEWDSRLLSFLGACPPERIRSHSAGEFYFGIFGDF